MTAAIALMLLAVPAGAQRTNRDDGKIHLGISVLLEEQISLIRNRRILLVTDDVAKDERGRSTRELFAKDRRIAEARVRLAGEVIAPSLSLWKRDSVTFEHSLDSLGALVNGFVVDLVDYGSRSGVASRALLTTLRVAARKSVPVYLLDRPNPITGEHLEGPVLDSTRAASDGVYGLPQRHGMTLGEMAKYFNEFGAIGASVTVVPVRGWRRDEWPSERRLDPPRLAGAEVSEEQLAMASAFALMDSTKVRFAFGPGREVVRVGAEQIDAKALAKNLGDRLMPGVEFSDARDRFDRATLSSIRIRITNRESATGSRIAEAVLGLIRQSVEDSDTIVDRQLPLLAEFRRRVRPYLLYR